jgi:hypothetical protein
MIKLGSLLQIWIVFNLVIGLYEIFIFKNSHRLQLQRHTVWSRWLVYGNISNFLLDAWSEYCNVDMRYLEKSRQYVWFFELLNAATAIVLAIIVIGGFNITCWKLIIAVQMINCVAYFISLAVEHISGRQIAAAGAQWWMFIIYYAISSIWIVIPLIILFSEQK